MKYNATLDVLIPFTILCFVVFSCNPFRKTDIVHLDVNAKPLERISDYGFFKDPVDFTKPNEGVVQYKMVNSMFNDYSTRANFIYIPQGQSFNFDSTNLLNLPAGSCLINVVYYYKDDRNISLGKRLIETQLIVRKQTGWEVLNYIWSDDQTEALLSESGGSKSITWKDKNGLEEQVHFVIPTKNECIHCHWYDDHLTPIGTKTGNLNLDVDYPSGKKNQLDHWVEAGLLKGFVKENALKYQNWKDTSQPIEQRIRAYLDANCACCHNAKGPALRTGLFLNADNYNMETFGLCKPVIFSGRATGYLKYDIVPGKPGQSTMARRMASTEFGVKMPEIGRSIIDKEGVSLINEWIVQLKGDCALK